MRRRLQTFAEKLRRETKHHEEGPGHGQVLRLFPYEGFGFIGTDDGREVYFNENAVIGDAFERLEAGMAVRFNEEMGEKGPQATSVHISRQSRAKGAETAASSV